MARPLTRDWKSRAGDVTRAPVNETGRVLERLQISINYL